MTPSMPHHPFDLLVAPLTSFGPDGSVDLDIIPAYATFLQQNGVTGVFVNGTTGEGFSLTLDERKAVLEKWIDIAPENFQIIAHVTCASVEESKQLARHAQQAGAHAFGMMAPIFFKPANVQALVDYAAEIAAAADLPCYFYHMPSMNGVDLPMIQFLECAQSKIPNLVGIKYTFEDLMDADFCRQFAQGQYNILHGRDETLLLALTMGATGAVGGTYNIQAKHFRQLIDAYHEGDLETAKTLQRQACDVIRVLAGTGKFIPASKAVLRWIGLDVQGIRAPLQNLTDAEEQTLIQNLTKINFRDFCNRIES